MSKDASLSWASALKSRQPDVLWESSTSYRLAGEAVDVEDAEYRKPLDLVRRRLAERAMRCAPCAVFISRSLREAAGPGSLASLRGRVRSGERRRERERATLRELVFCLLVSFCRGL